VADALDRPRIAAVVDAVIDRLPGDWLLIGGGLVALWLEPRRLTEDIDLIGLPGSAADRLALLGLANDLGLPVEALNSAADFFVHRITDWRAHLVLFRSGATGRVFRPSATLFLLLKLARLSEQDLADCLSLLDPARAEASGIDLERVLAAMAALPPAADPQAASRRDRLRQALGVFAAFNP
jgi:hypothetical protein